MNTFEIIKRARQGSEEGYIVKHDGDLFFAYDPDDGINIEECDCWAEIERHCCYGEYDPEAHNYYEINGFMRPLVLDDEPTEEPKATAEERYLVIDERFGGDDVDTKVYTTLEEANAVASRDWDNLSPHGKNSPHIYVALVRREDLSDWAVDDETGEVDWNAFTQCDIPDGAFDSKAGKPIRNRILHYRLASGMSRNQFADYFKIPYRTLQAWELGDREAPEYLVDLIEYKLKNEGKIK